MIEYIGCVYNGVLVCCEMCELQDQFDECLNIRLSYGSRTISKEMGKGAGSTPVGAKQ